MGFQVKGKNQLFKEIEETKDIDDKTLDLGALHRNERTMEIEGESRNPDLIAIPSVVNSTNGGAEVS